MKSEVNVEADSYNNAQDEADMARMGKRQETRVSGETVWKIVRGFIDRGLAEKFRTHNDARPLGDDDVHLGSGFCVSNTRSFRFN